MNLAANRFRLGIKPSHFRFHSMASSLPRLYCARHFGITFVAARPRNFRTCGIFSNIQTDRKAQYFNVLKRTFPTSPRVEDCDISTPTSTTTRRDKGRPTFREIKMERFVLIFHCPGYCFVGFLIVRFFRLEENNNGITLIDI